MPELHPNAELTIAQACLDCLLGAVKKLSANEPSVGFIHRTIIDNESDESPFTLYAAEFWSHHVKSARAGPNSPVKDEIRNLLRSPVLVGICAELLEGHSISGKRPGKGAHLAAGLDLIEIFREMCDEDKEVLNAKDDKGNTPLIISAHFGAANTTAFLLQLQDTNLRHVNSSERTALSEAAVSGQASIVNSLLKEDIKRSGSPRANAEFINGRDEFGQTPLYRAVSEGHLETVKLLLEVGAEINIVDKEGIPLLAIACICGGKDVTDALLNHQGTNHNQTGIKRKTPLAFAAEVGNSDAVERLLSVPSVNPGRQSQNNRIPLSYAAESGSIEAVKILLDSMGRCRGGFPRTYTVGNQYIDNQSIEGRTPLSYAAEKGHDDVVRILLEAGADPEGASDHMAKRTPLWFAAVRGHETVIRALLEHDAKSMQRMEKVKRHSQLPYPTVAPELCSFCC
ncbi:hypothetical protein DPSP01_014544 [Paraphaeosphaeria sporulosa]